MDGEYVRLRDYAPLTTQQIPKYIWEWAGIRVSYETKDYKWRVATTLEAENRFSWVGEREGETVLLLSTRTRQWKMYKLC